MLLNLARVWRLYRLFVAANPAVFSAGNVLTAAGLNDATLSGITSYTPVVANGGTVTWTTRTGWYYKIGTSHLVFFNAYLNVNAAGSGTTDLTITAPTNVDRTTRQAVPCDWTDSSTIVREGHVMANVGGAGAVLDKIRLMNAAAVGGSNMQGSNLVAGGFLTLQGFYRES